MTKFLGVSVARSFFASLTLVAALPAVSLASTTVEGSPFWELDRPFDVQCEFRCPLGVNIVERVSYVVRSNGLKFPNDTRQVLFCSGGNQTVAHTLPSPLTFLTGTDLRCFVRFTPLVGVDQAEFEDADSSL
ncbi:MAG: hypothetical protein IOD12_04290 [Silvanigrellales bacterium]|jgi:hypothetical protein|nr:hypothetical protein [Silvanigrellales bacterium]